MFPTVASEPISRSTLMQEIHLATDITIEMPSPVCEQPVHSYVAVCLFPRWKVQKQLRSSQTPGKGFLFSSFF